MSFPIQSGPLSPATLPNLLDPGSSSPNQITVSNGQVIDCKFILIDSVGQFDANINDYAAIVYFAQPSNIGDEDSAAGNIFSPVAVPDPLPGAGSSSVPGPLPVLGASAAFAWSRRLRRRCQRSGRAGSVGPRV